MTTIDKTQVGRSVQHQSAELTVWLNNCALPMWTALGADIDKGECYESIDLATQKPLFVARRARVVPRQIYSFLEGAKLGWSGPAEALTKGLYKWFLDAYHSNEGYFISSVDVENRVTDQTFDLYNQAFALFAFAQIAGNISDLQSDAEEHASDLLNYLTENYRNPHGGYREANPDKLPLCSNPHMHMFEACLAWEAISADPAWRELSDEIAELALNRFIDPVTGGLREFFEMDWSPFSEDLGRVMEPGHQFEWAWLLARWGQSRSDAGALIAARRLYDIAWTYGIDESRGVTFMAMNDDFSVRDPIARLWGQTEWLKAAIALAEISNGPERNAYLSDIPDAANAMRKFFESAPEGLWRDKMSPDGAFEDEPAPASSLYHIVCAISELNRFAAGK